MPSMERLIERPMQRHGGHTPFKALLEDRDWGTVESYDAARVIEDLIESPGWDLLAGLLAERKTQLELQLVYGGGINEHVQAARLAGEIAGLDAARNAAEAIVLVHQALIRENESEESR